MKSLLNIILALFLAFLTPITVTAENMKIYVAIQVDMEMGLVQGSQDKKRLNSPERIFQYMVGKGFKTKKDCETYLLEDTGSKVIEKYRDELVWNNYAPDNIRVVQQWRCLGIFVMRHYLDE